jgi:hypothetical protein
MVRVVAPIGSNSESSVAVLVDDVFEDGARFGKRQLAIGNHRCRTAGMQRLVLRWRDAGNRISLIANPLIRKAPREVRATALENTVADPRADSAPLLKPHRQPRPSWRALNAKMRSGITGRAELSGCCSFVDQNHNLVHLVHPVILSNSSSESARRRACGDPEARTG